MNNILWFIDQSVGPLLRRQNTRYKNPWLVVQHEQICWLWVRWKTSNKTKLCWSKSTRALLSSTFFNLLQKYLFWDKLIMQCEKCETSTKNLQQNNVARQVESFCILYFAASKGSPPCQQIFLFQTVPFCISSGLHKLMFLLVWIDLISWKAIGVKHMISIFKEFVGLSNHNSTVRWSHFTCIVSELLLRSSKNAFIMQSKSTFLEFLRGIHRYKFGPPKKFFRGEIIQGEWRNFIKHVLCT